MLTACYGEGGEDMLIEQPSIWSRNPWLPILSREIPAIDGYSARAPNRVHSAHTHSPAPKLRRTRKVSVPKETI